MPKRVVVPVDGDSRAGQPRGESASPGTPLKVLLGSGEGLLKKNLARWGYDVTVVADGHQALALLSQPDHPKLAILNYEMDGLGGAGLCRRVRAEPVDPYTYMILLMEPSQKDDLLEAFEQGADDYLVKPFDGYELRAKLLVAKRILALQDRLIAMRDELQVQATHDALTGLWNRRASTAALDRELARAARENKTVGLMLADLDHFKHINDTYGHLAGDRVLQAVAAKLKAAMRPYDTIGRYGGEEFLVISPGCDERAILRRAEHLCASIAREPVATPEGNIPVTLSLGAAVATGTTPQEQLLKAADAALYRAKHAGRNRVELALAGG
jgi:diguanylate cyclase (GGDEF)-like protein